jgi:pimeloyl-ACP methyl ester carboxylesterase
MYQLFTDNQFHFETLRTLGLARYSGSDVGEVLNAASKIKIGDFESWYEAFYALAERLNQHSKSIIDPIGLRDTLFRAATYYRMSDFFLHGNKKDPRILSLWRKQEECFDMALGLLDVPGERINVQTEHGFYIPCILYRCSDDKTSRPTLILTNGYDGPQEELLHVFGFAALERGYNVITYEGPGQPSVVRYQGKGFICEWEKVVTPVVTYFSNSSQFPEIDNKKIALLGYSFGGFLTPRAAAFENRLAALITVDGVIDCFEAFSASIPSEAKLLLQSSDPSAKTTFDTQANLMLKNPHLPTGVKWGFEQGLWSFDVDSAYDYFQRVKPMNLLGGLASKIECPTLVFDAEGEKYFVGAGGKSQPERLKEAIGENATLVKLTADDAAAEHCHVGASVLMNQILFDWLGQVFGLF